MQYIGISPYWKEINLNKLNYESQEQEKIFKNILNKPNKLNIFSNAELIEALKVFYYNDMAGITEPETRKTIITYYKILNFLMLVDEKIANIINNAIAHDGDHYIDQLILIF